MKPKADTWVQDPKKKPYRAPRLVTYGDLRRLTMAAACPDPSQGRPCSSDIPPGLD